MMMLMLMISALFMTLSHPLMMGIILLMMTLLISLISGLMNNFWFSYILFIIMIGGLLILFLYMTSIASNELIKLSNSMTIIMSLSCLTLLIMSPMMDKFLFFYFNINSPLINYNSMNMSFNKFFNYPNNLIMFMLIMYLFLTLIATVKITNIKYGPMRQFK
uniref:NADH-ubiquinone oxidoreductase chain 6 n=1 Tax=Lucifotychus sp. 1 EF-2015 TaxID=1756870 RepID=A0A0S2M7M6_9COLE|nr:NADH deshydrogenase subunit 6 [Lucifotychus sp. 1 EF-2015]